MAKNFPKDEFDFVTRSGGHYRGKLGFVDRLIGFSKYLAATAALSAASIFALIALSSGSQLQGALDDIASTIIRTNETYKGSSLGVTVLDATGKSGTASKVAKKLLDAGWNVYGAANKALTENEPAPSNTLIVVNSEAAQKAAQGLLADLGSYQITLQNVYTDPITVVLGTDYH